MDVTPEGFNHPENPVESITHKTGKADFSIDGDTLVLENVTAGGEQYR